MARIARTRSKRKRSSSPLMVRLDEESKSAIADAAKLRRISVSDYVRSITVAQAKREIEAANGQTICLSPGEQLAFWNALKEAPVLTAAQRKLGNLMRGKK